MSVASIADRIASARRVQVHALGRAKGKDATRAADGDASATNSASTSATRPPVGRVGGLTRTQQLHMEISYEEMLAEFNEFLPAISWYYGYGPEEVATTKAYINIETDAGRRELVATLAQWKVDLIVGAVDCATFEDGTPVLSEKLSFSARAYFSEYVHALHPEDKTEASVQPVVATPSKPRGRYRPR